MTRFLQLIFIGLLIFSGSAQAQDSCGDVLRNGTLKSHVFRDNFYVKQVELRYLKDHSYSEASAAHRQGLGAFYGGIGLEYESKKESYEAKQKALTSFSFDQVDVNRKIENIISSGDSDVLSAWTTCMSNRGGLSAYFERSDSRQATLILKWNRLPNDPNAPASARLLSDIPLPEWAVPSDDGRQPRCWIAQGAPDARPDDGVITTSGCPVLLNFSSPQETYTRGFYITIHTDRDRPAVAALAPRIRFTTQYATRLVHGIVSVRGGKKNYRANGTTIIAMDPADVSAGWIFDAGKFVAGPSSFVGSRDPQYFASCGAPPTVLVADENLQVSSVVRNEWTGRNVSCKIGGQITLVRIVSGPM